MKFLSSWTIDLENIPAYADLNKPFTEYVDSKLGNLLLNCSDSRINDLSRQEFQKLMNCVKNDKLLVKYNAPYDVGRRYAECPSQVLPNGGINFKNYSSLLKQQRIIKNTMFSFLDWIDLDQKKGHPTILLCVAQKNKFELKSYEEYLAEGRFDEIVSDFSDYYSADENNKLDKSDIKMLFNMTIYGGGYKRWVENIITGEFKETEDGSIICTWPPKPMKNIESRHPFYVKFYNDTQRVISTVYNSNPALANLVCKDLPNNAENEYKRRNRVMSYFCGILENDITYKAYKWLVDNHIIERYVVDWGLDGLTFPKPIIDSEYDYISKMNEAVRKKTGMNLVTFEVKKFVDVLEHLIEKRKTMIDEVAEDKPVDKKDEDESYNDVTEANHILSKYPHWKYCQKTLYCFDDTTGMWTDDDGVHRGYIKKFARGKYNKFVNYMNGVRTYIKSICVDNDFIEKNANSSLKKLLFKNGYYDADTCTFHTKFNPKILFFARINHDFKRCSKESLDIIRKKFFHDPLSKDVGDYYLQLLSRAIMGDKMKKIIFGLGKTDCGKSTLTAAITKSFGGYVGTFNANNLVKKNTDDMAQSLRWCLILRYSRIVFSNELDEDRDLNSALIKAISGETDNIVARGHCKDETSFLPHFLPICFANGMSDILPYDPAVDGRIEVFDYKKQFVKSDPIEDQLLQDPNLKYEMETEDFQQTFTSLFIQEFETYKLNGELPRPSACMNAKQKWVSQSNHIDNIKNFLQDFEFTDNIEDKIFSKEIHNYVSELESKVTSKKFIVEMKEHINKQGYKNVVSKSVSISGIKGQGWTGIKRLL